MAPPSPHQAQALEAQEAEAEVRRDAVLDRLTTMRIQEESLDYRCVDYLSYAAAEAATSESCAAAGSSSSSGSDEDSKASKSMLPIDSDCRLKMAEWSTQVVDFCKFTRETVSMAMNYLDRFLSASIISDASSSATRARTSRREYQLASMTCLYIAVKLNEPLEMDTQLVSELSRGCHTPQEIAQMEADILESLRWKMCGPTPLGFLGHFLALLPTRARESEVEQTILDLGRCQTELAASDYALAVPLLPSSIGMAVLLNAMEALGEEDMNEEERDEFLALVEEASGVNAEDDDVVYARSRLMSSFSDSRGSSRASNGSERKMRAQAQAQAPARQASARLEAEAGSMDTVSNPSSLSEMDEDDISTVEPDLESEEQQQAHRQHEKEEEQKKRAQWRRQRQEATTPESPQEQPPAKRRLSTGMESSPVCVTE